jgi:hypothetical protein
MIIVAGIDFIGRRPICGLYLQRDGCFWALPMRTTAYSGSSISSSLVVEKKLGDDVSASYVVPIDATTNILSSIQMGFELVPMCWILRHV